MAHKLGVPIIIDNLTRPEVTPKTDKAVRE